MVEHYAAHDIDDSNHVTGTFWGIPVADNIQKTYYRLLDFFEREMGCFCTDEDRKIIERKKSESEEHRTQRAAEKQVPA